MPSGDGQELNVERERRASLQGLQKQRAEKLGSIAKDKRDRSTLMGKGSQERAKQFDTVSVAAEAVRFQVEQARRRLQALFALKDEVADTRTNKTPMRLRQLQQTHSEAGLSAENWKAFALDFVGGVDGILAEGIKTIEGRIRGLTGPTPGEAVADASTLTTSLLPDGAELGKQTLSLLDKELARLRALMGVDAENAKAFARLSEKISRDEAALAKLERDIEAAGRSEERIRVLIQSRRDSYAAVFDGIIEEEKELSALYAPLKARLEAEEGALGKLSFSIRRSVDVAVWAQQGEALLDLRKTGPFKGHGDCRNRRRPSCFLPGNGDRAWMSLKLWPSSATHMKLN